MTMNKDETKKMVEDTIRQVLQSEETKKMIRETIEESLGDLIAIREYNETNIFN